jgi:hypothetical protein
MEDEAMTLRKVIETAAQLGGWIITWEGTIRRFEEGAVQCPITAVVYEITGRFYWPFEWLWAIKQIDLDVHEAERLVQAADNAEDWLIEALNATVQQDPWPDFAGVAHRR